MLIKRLEEILKEEEYIENHPSQLPAFLRLARAIAEKNFADNEVEATVFIEFAIDADMVKFLYTSKGEALYYREDEDMKEEGEILDEYLAYFEEDELMVLEGENARVFFEEETISEKTPLKLTEDALNSGSEIFMCRKQ